MFELMTLLRKGWWVILLQTGLALIEWFSGYDTAPRRAALVLTNVASTGIILWVMAYAERRHQSVTTVALVLVLAGVWADAIGNFTHQYGHNWWYDRLTHGFGGLAATALAIEIYRLQALSHRWTLGAGLITWVGFCLGQMAGAVYEVSEYLGDLVAKTQRVGAGFDTSRDLTFNLVGGVIAALVLWPILRRSLRSGKKMV